MRIVTDHLRGQALAAGAAVLWGTSYPAIGIATRDAGPLSIALVRGVSQAVILGLALLVIRPTIPVAETARRPPPVWILAGLGLLGGFFNVGQAIAVDASGPVASAFVAGLYPVLTVLFATLLIRERLSWRVLAGCLLAAAGTVLLADLGQLDRAHVTGLAVAVLSAVTFALYLVASRHAMRAYAIPPLYPTLAVFGGVVVQTVLALAVTGDSPLPAAVTPVWLAAMAWLVLGSGIAPLAMSELSVRRAPLMRTSPYLFLAPLVAALIGLGPLGIGMSVAQLGGGALAVAGMVLATWPSLSAPDPRPPVPTETHAP
jgi:drug/metabolite transporter (DMT)-like permease